MMDPGKGIRLRSSARTSVGQVRSHNEDSIHLWEGKTLVLAIVADGMGGAAGGEEASRIAIETISDQMGMDSDQADDAWMELAEQEMRSAVKAANLSIMEEANARPTFRGMGTTLTMAVIRGTRALLAHVGDSRGYRVSPDGTITQITADHSFVQALLDAGHITKEQAENHPMGNVLYRALGQTEEVDVDTYQSDLQVGDRLVLCSDGLTRHVREKEIAMAAIKHADPADASQQLIDLANERGGEDNISVIVVLVEKTQQRNDDDDDTIVLPKPGDNDDTIPFRTPPTGANAQNADDPIRWDELSDEPTERLHNFSTIGDNRRNAASSSSDGDIEGHDISTPDQ